MAPRIPASSLPVADLNRALGKPGTNVYYLSEASEEKLMLSVLPSGINYIKEKHHAENSKFQY